MATHSSILPGESHEQRSLVGYSPWGHTESDTTEVTTYHAACMHEDPHVHLLFPCWQRKILCETITTFKVINMSITSEKEMATHSSIAWKISWTE